MQKPIGWSGSAWCPGGRTAAKARRTCPDTNRIAALKQPADGEQRDLEASGFTGVSPRSSTPPRSDA
jgi:hypothetical protein